MTICHYFMPVLRGLKMNNNYELEADLRSYPYCEITTYCDYVRPHFHYKIEVLYCLNGEINVCINEKNFLLHKNDYIFINSGVIHSTYNKNRNHYYNTAIPRYSLLPAIKTLPDDYILLHDDDETMKHMLKSLRDRSDRLHIKPISQQETAFVVSVANSIISYFAMNSEKALPRPRRDDSLLEMISYIFDNYRDPKLDTASAAQRFGYTPRMLSDLFNRNLHVGVKRYIDILRVNDSKYQLLSTSDNIDAIAERVGFDSVRSFYRVFQKLTGITPGDYRASQMPGV